MESSSKFGISAKLEFVPLVDLPEVGPRQQGYLTLSNFRIRFHKQAIDNDPSKVEVSFIYQGVFPHSQDCLRGIHFHNFCLERNAFILSSSNLLHSCF